MWNLKPPPKDICQYNNLKNILFSHSPTKGQNMIKVIGTPDIPLHSRGVYPLSIHVGFIPPLFTWGLPGFPPWLARCLSGRLAYPQGWYLVTEGEINH